MGRNKKVQPAASTSAKPPKSRKPPKKRGNKGDFHGSRKQYLTSLLPAYDAARGKSGFADFWSDTFSGYWRRFPWTVPIDQEPPATLPEDDLSKLSEEEMKQRADILTNTEQVSFPRVFSIQIRLPDDPSLRK